MMTKKNVRTGNRMPAGHRCQGARRLRLEIKKAFGPVSGSEDFIVKTRYNFVSSLSSSFKATVASCQATFFEDLIFC
jgi:hypothetical protein